MKRHTGEELKGRLKRAAGEATGDKGLKREGTIDQGSARTKESVGNAADKLKRAVNPKD